MNLPNKLTLLRIFLVPIFIYFLLTNRVHNNLLYALIIFFIASFTDHLDGKLARKKNLVTVFGKFLDPLADKILIMSAFVCFVEMGLIGAVPVIIIFSREFVVTSLRLTAASNGEVIGANFWGKLKTIVQILSVMIIIFLRYINLSVGKINYSTCKIISENLIWLCTILTVMSGCIYIKNNYKFINIKNSEN